MKKNGFTLVELLITIALIAILGVISVGVIINSLGDAKNDLNEYQLEILKSTAELYFNDNVDTSEVGTEYIVYIQKDLVSNNYLNEFENNAFYDTETIYGKIILKITKDNNGIIKKVKAKDVLISDNSSIEN